MAGGTEPTEAQAVVRETLNYASGEGGEAGCWLWYHPLLLYLHFFLLTDTVDEGRQMKFHRGSAFQAQGYRNYKGVHLSFPFSAPFHWIGRNVSYSTGEGAGREGPVSSDKDVCWGDAPMTHLCLWIGQRVVLERAALILRDEDHLLPHLQWAMGSWGHHFSCSVSPWKINSLLELHCQQRGNEIGLKWRQKTFTFFIYGYGCSLVSLLVFWRNFTGSLLLSFAGLVPLLLFIEPFSPHLLTPRCQAVGSISVHCHRLYSLHGVCVQIATQDTCLLHTGKYHSSGEFLFNEQCILFFWLWLNIRNIFGKLLKETDLKEGNVSVTSESLCTSHSLRPSRPLMFLLLK